ncbi:MAG: NAD(P)/FAD-dependent oxidoreductase [Legionellaceae bacterium]|nr:NAD(P)/FAD-dependent oxidoreductase [Legionellaceae bacterium]
MNILIVGAGPVGLTAGVELARQGAHVEIIEKKEAGSTLSRAIGINPHSLKILEASGVTEKLLAEGIKYEAAHFYHQKKPWVTLQLNAASPIQYGYNFMLGLPQDRTESILSKVFTHLGGSIHYDTKLKSITQGKEGVIAKTSAGQAFSCDYLIGADGVHSVTRQLIGIDCEYTELPEIWSIADVDADRNDLADGVSVYLLDPGKIVFIAPIGERRFRLVSNTKQVLKVIPTDLNITKIRREAEFKINIGQVKNYQKGRVFLAGDAAHAHSPVGGRGMNLGIADAADLAEKLVTGAGDEYTASRYAEGKKIIAGSEMLRKILGTTSPWRHFLVLKLFKLIAAVPALQRKFASKFLYG